MRMHSEQFTRLAQAADQNGWDIVATVDIPEQEGTYPAAWCVCHRNWGGVPGVRNYLVTMGVMPTEEENHYGVMKLREAFFVSSTYDLTLPRALQLLAEKAAFAHGVVA